MRGAVYLLPHALREMQRDDFPFTVSFPRDRNIPESVMTTLWDTLHDRGFEVGISPDRNSFLLHSAHTSFGTHVASCAVGSGGLPPTVGRPEREDVNQPLLSMGRWTFPLLRLFTVRCLIRYNNKFTLKFIVFRKHGTLCSWKYNMLVFNCSQPLFCGPS
jgi:hypothetical protein